MQERIVDYMEQAPVIVLAAEATLRPRLAASKKELAYVLMVFDDGIDGGSYASYRASPSIDGIRREHAGRDIPYGDRKT